MFGVRRSPNRRVSLVGREPNSEVVCPDCLAAPDPPRGCPSLRSVMPGRSAAREYHRRTLRDRETARRKRPVRLAAVAVVAALAYCGVQVLAALVDHGRWTADEARPTGSRSSPSPPPMFSESAAAVGAALVLALPGSGGRKQSTDAWAKGSQGEKQLADRLSRLLPKGVVLDSRPPHTRYHCQHRSHCCRSCPASLFWTPRTRRAGWRPV